MFLPASVWVPRRLTIWLLVFNVMLGACSRPPEKVTEISRGRLRCTGVVERRRVNNYWWEVFVDDQPFVLPGATSNKVGQCQASNNPQSTALVLLFGDDCWSLHPEASAKLGKSDGERVVATPLEKPDGMDALEQYKSAEFSCDGRCLVWPTQLTFLDTNETRKLPPLPSRFIGLSPDLQTAVTEGRNDLENDRISLNLVDLQTGKVTERILPRAKHLWLLDYTERVEGIAAHFKWQRGASGKDELVYPAEEKAQKRK